ncbi:sialic acid-binding Ig-like lectin 6 [Choloepus didactylus]|uniref:sialic acid-binding Ig-like lectin 6 n=1 Tax=Choloepus didactylus TaxID=27675 RepID=UPI00189DA321|nr:sialic acid-binding Ig-like lectin 6 [Choloepus didactylus]
MLLLLPLLWAGSLAQDSRYRLRVQESVTVQEGLCVFVPCQVIYVWKGWTDSFPCPWWNDSRTALGFWFREKAAISRDAPVATNNPHRSVQGVTQGQFHLLGDPRRCNCSLDIRDAQSGVEGTYFFQVEKGHMKHSYLLNKVSVHVTALTQTPDIQIPGTLESGSPSSLTCAVPWACERGTPPTFSWRSAALPSLGPSTRLSPVLTLTQRPQDHGTNLTCQVTFPGAGVTVERTVQLSISYAPQNLTIVVHPGDGSALRSQGNISSLPVLGGQALRLLCEADSNPPAQLSWFWGSPALNTFPISDSGVLELPRVGTDEEGEFTCRARHPLGSLHVSLSLSVLCECGALGRLSSRTRMGSRRCREEAGAHLHGDLQLGQTGLKTS